MSDAGQIVVSTEEEGFTLRAGGQILRTPAGRPLAVPSARLAEALANEWRRQGRKIDPTGMPLTRLVFTATDRIAGQRDSVIKALVGYGSSDLLCYRAASPRDLAERQELIWQPMVDWASQTLGVELAVTFGVVHIPQPPASLHRLEEIVAAYDDLRLAGLQGLVGPLGSLILGLAVAVGRLEAATAFAAAHLDEDYTLERWGHDDEAVERRRLLQQDVEEAAEFLSYCPPI